LPSFFASELHIQCQASVFLRNIFRLNGRIIAASRLVPAAMQVSWDFAGMVIGRRVNNHYRFCTPSG
jgi:hypothetical protein